MVTTFIAAVVLLSFRPCLFSIYERLRAFTTFRLFSDRNRSCNGEYIRGCRRMLGDQMAKLDSNTLFQTFQ